MESLNLRAHKKALFEENHIKLDGNNILQKPDMGCIECLKFMLKCGTTTMNYVKHGLTTVCTNVYEWSNFFLLFG